MSTIFADKFKNTSGGNPVQINQLRGIDTAGSITVQGEGTATTNMQQGLAKVWLLGGNDASLTDSFNTASGTDNGVGDYTYTFTSAMSSANFTSHATGANNARRYGFSEARTTTTNRFDYRDEGGNAADNTNSSAMHGDLA